MSSLAAGARRCCRIGWRHGCRRHGFLVAHAEISGGCDGDDRERRDGCAAPAPRRARDRILRLRFRDDRRRGRRGLRRGRRRSARIGAAFMATRSVSIVDRLALRTQHEVQGGAALVAEAGARRVVVRTERADGSVRSPVDFLCGVLHRHRRAYGNAATRAPSVRRASQALASAACRGRRLAAAALRTVRDVRAARPRSSSTGTVASRKIASVSLPVSTRRMPRRPCVPSTTRSAFTLGAGNYHVSHGLCHGTNDDRLELDPGVARCAVDRCQ